MKDHEREDLRTGCKLVLYGKKRKKKKVAHCAWTRGIIESTCGQGVKGGRSARCPVVGVPDLRVPLVFGSYGRDWKPIGAASFVGAGSKPV